MRYIKEILKKNSIWVLVYIGLGIFNFEVKKNGEDSEMAQKLLQYISVVES